MFRNFFPRIFVILKLWPVICLVLIIFLIEIRNVNDLRGIGPTVLSKQCPIKFYEHRVFPRNDNQRAFSARSDVIPSNITGYFQKFTNQLNTRMTNPCWQHNGTLQCLPYYFIAGVSKAASTDLYYKMSLHPQIYPGNKKEQYWWTRKFHRIWHPKCRDDPQCVQTIINGYPAMFSNAASCIDSVAHTNLSSGPVHLITGDGTPDTMADSYFWREWPGNKGLTEPRYVLAHYIRHYMPWARIIFIVRNPIERLWSFYRFIFKPEAGRHVSPILKPSAVDFHPRVLEQIEMFTNCTATKSRRACLFSYRHIQPGLKLDALEGLYFDYIREFLSVFPRQQVHIVRTEDYQEHPIRELNRVFKFLGLDPLPPSIGDYLKALPRANDQRQNITMWPETRALLREFYEPTNQALADMMHDKGYLWNN